MLDDAVAGGTFGEAETERLPIKLVMDEMEVEVEDEDEEDEELQIVLPPPPPPPPLFIADLLSLIFSEPGFPPLFDRIAVGGGVFAVTFTKSCCCSWRKLEEEEATTPSAGP